jgi:hypothetical protein
MRRKLTVCVLDAGRSEQFQTVLTGETKRAQRIIKKEKKIGQRQEHPIIASGRQEKSEHHLDSIGGGLRHPDVHHCMVEQIT